jgi:FtsZ-binding cell division protein ZapB
MDDSDSKESYCECCGEYHDDFESCDEAELIDRLGEIESLKDKVEQLQTELASTRNQLDALRKEHSASSQLKSDLAKARSHALAVLSIAEKERQDNLEAPE